MHHYLLIEYFLLLFDFAGNSGNDFVFEIVHTVEYLIF